MPPTKRWPRILSACAWSGSSGLELSSSWNRRQPASPCPLAPRSMPCPPTPRRFAASRTPTRSSTSSRSMRTARRCSAVQPYKTWGGRVELISTRHGPFYPFEQEWERCRKWDGQWDRKACKVKRFKVDIYDAVRDGLAVEVRRARRRGPPPAQGGNRRRVHPNPSRGRLAVVWETEYECNSPPAALA